MGQNLEREDQPLTAEELEALYQLHRDSGGIRLPEFPVREED